ncbi:MAG: hypothetical protein IJ133_01210 [Clostridia bacterium]|nr:hypothetical protein [Clostridia bacterium]
MQGLDYVGMLLDLEDAFHKKIDLLTTEQLDPDFRQAISKDGILLYERETSPPPIRTDP